MSAPLHGGGAGDCGNLLVAGVDEAGRGPLAGPVVAAAVILAHPIEGLDDSKKLSAKRRRQLEQVIRGESRCWSIAMASAAEIDALNIHRATLLAMRRAVLGLRRQPARVLVDGRFVPNLAMPCRAEIGGDARFAEVAAASILAKEARDEWMRRLDLRCPEYGFARHKGYPTAAHRDAIARHGVHACHRRSFGPVRARLEAGA